MTIAWVVYGLLVGLLIAAGALALDQACRMAKRPVRWVWAGALVLTVVLVGIAPFRSFVFDPSSHSQSAEAATSSPYDPTVALQRAATIVGGAIAAISQRIPAAFDRYALGVWVALSTVLLTVFAVVYHRFHRRQRGWPAIEICNIPVRLAPNGGPVVVGLTQSEIVVPRWLLARSLEEQHLVLAHESEHVRARDPLLLASACAVAILLPWHPAVWWMLSRLRLAIELDCDTRVLRQGASPRTYGALLINLAGRHAGLPVGMPALADTTSHLQQRLLAMTPQRLRFAPARGMALSTFAVLAILAACSAELPVATAPDLSSQKTDTTATLALASVEMPVISLVLLDGKTIEGSATGGAVLSLVNPSRIASIEIVKEPTATARYGKAAANGVILITTKKDASQ